jgi:excisionase family DNA binding protein
MAHFSLREAAEQAGTSKSTIWRAIKAGRLSAARTDDGGFAIDAAELFRVFPPQRLPDAMGQDATASETASESPATGATGRTDSLAVRLGASEAEIAGLKAVIALMQKSQAKSDENEARLRDDIDEAKRDRDEWKGAAQRLETDKQRLATDHQRLLSDHNRVERELADHQRLLAGPGPAPSFWSRLFPISRAG